MSTSKNPGIHTAEDAALGFYFQTFYALLTLLRHTSDDASICVEGLDDVELVASSVPLLIQLKHTVSANPAPISIKSKAVWRTLKVWIDAISDHDLSTASFHLVTVGEIDPASPLTLLQTSAGEDRTPLCDALVLEATRVVDESDSAIVLGTKPLPFQDRVAGCRAFLMLCPTIQASLIRRITILPGSKNIAGLEGLVCAELHYLPKIHREAVSRKLVGWWDREIVYSLCGKRHRFIHRQELQTTISELIGDILHEKLVPEFETANPPENYQPDGMLTKQIALVGGLKADLTKAIREEWRARAQRSNWINDNLGMATQIAHYDDVLEESWKDVHDQVVEENMAAVEPEKCSSGLKILRWSHDVAPGTVRAFSEGWNTPYYIRGSYQVLAIGLRVGWHPDFKQRLDEKL